MRDSIIARQDSVIAGLDQQLGLYQAMLVASDSIARRAVRERDSYRALARDFQKRAQPGVFEQARRALPFVVVGIVIWEAAR